MKQRVENPIVVGMVGTGYGCELHGGGYENMVGIPVRLKTVCGGSNRARAEAMKERYGYEQVTMDYMDVIRDPEIDVVDINTNQTLHVPIALAALRAGKHVICEKPLTGYVGNGEDGIGRTVPKAVMYESVMAQMEELREAIRSSGRKFMYAENQVYAPPVQKAAEILRAKKSKIVLMNSENTLIGSSSPKGGHWNQIGGGTLMRNGIHGLTAMLWLKRQEAKARGEEFGIVGVMADTGVQTAAIEGESHRYIRARPVDVEDMAIVTVTFRDGTKCVSLCSDAVLGGSRNTVTVYAHDATLRCNLNPCDILNTYFMDEEGLEDVYISEMLPQKTGWNQAFVSDEIIRGYAGELKDFMECIAFDREPDSDFDLACDVMRVIYAAYRSSEEGRRILF